MARKKKNKNLQTFNVYPFLAEYGINSSYLPKAQNGNMGDTMGLEYFKNNYPGFNELTPNEQNQLLNQYMNIQNDEYIPQTQMIPGLAEFSDQYNTAMQFRQDNPTTYGTNYAFSSMPTYYQGPNEGFSRIIIDEDLRNLINTQSNASDFSSMLSGMKPGQNVFVDYKTDYSMPGGYTYDMPGKGPMSPAFQGNLNQAQIEQLIALSNQLNTPPVYPDLPSENQVFTANDLKIDEPSLGNITLTEIPENREEDENINAVSQENIITIPKRTIQNIPVNNEASIIRTTEDPEEKLSKQELRKRRRAEMFKDAYTPQTRIAEEGTEVSETENQQNYIDIQNQMLEAQRKSVQDALGSGIPGYANTNAFNLANLITGIGKFGSDAGAGFPNMINPATGKPYEKSNFEKITVTNPTGENRILNKELLQKYIDGDKEDRENINQEDLWQKPEKVRMDYFNQFISERDSYNPGMFSNMSMDLDGNISYDDVTVPNPNYDEELFKTTGDPQYGPTIVEPFDLEKHGTAFDKAEQNLADYNMDYFVSDDNTFTGFDPDNINFTRMVDGQITTEAYDPTRNYRNHTVTTNIQEDINDQFKEENEGRFGGTIRFQNGGGQNLGLVGNYSEENMEVPFEPPKGMNIQEINTVDSSEQSSIKKDGIETSYSDKFESMGSHADSAGSDQYSIPKSFLQKIFGKGTKGNMIVGDLSRARDNRIIMKEAQAAGFNDINAYLSSLGYDVTDDNQIVSRPSISKTYSMTSDGDYTGAYGSFTLPSENFPGGQFTFTDKEGRLLTGDEAKNLYYQTFGQYTDDISGLYSDPNLGTFLPEITVTPKQFGGGLRRFFQAGGTPVDQNFTQIDNNNDGLPDYMDMSLQMGPFPEYDQDGDGIPDLVEAPGPDNPQMGPDPFIGPLLESEVDEDSMDDETDTDDLGIEIDKGNFNTRARKFLYTSKFANVADSLTRNILDPAIDFIGGLKNQFDNETKERRAAQLNDEAMEIVPTIEASRASKGDREFRTGEFRPISETQEEIYGQLAQLGGQPVNVPTGPDYSMLLQYIPTPTTMRFDEIYLQKQMNQGGQVVDVDMNLLKELMAAGADIEIL